jgi:hypothetical protein
VLYMSNRYIDFSNIVYGRPTATVKKHLQNVTTEKENKRKNRVQDLTEQPKRIFANNAFRIKLKQMQDAMNLRNEVDRVHSDIHSGRIPANRERLYRTRLNLLRDHLRHLEPLISEGGHYRHV